MILYTLQSKEFDDMLEEKLYIYADEKYEKYENTGDIEKYYKIVNCLEEKVPKPKNIKFPIWAFQSIFGKTGKELLIHLVVRFVNDEFYKYIYEIDIPDEKLILFVETEVDNEYAIKTNMFTNDEIVQAVFWDLKKENIIRKHDISGDNDINEFF